MAFRLKQLQYDRKDVHHLVQMVQLNNDLKNITILNIFINNGAIFFK